MEVEKFLEVSVVAQILNVSESTVRRMRKWEGCQLEFVDFGPRCVRIRKTSVDRIKKALVVVATPVIKQAL